MSNLSFKAAFIFQVAGWQSQAFSLAQIFKKNLGCTACVMVDIFLWWTLSFDVERAACSSVYEML